MSFEENKTVLGSLIRHKKGFAFKSKDYIEDGVPVIRVSNFSGDSISPNDLKFVSNEIAIANKDVRLYEHDIVIATVGSWPNNPASVVGRTISVPRWANNALMNQNSVIIRAQSNSKVDQKFIYYQLKTEQFSHHLISKAQGSANQASITLDAIFSYEINWPDSGLRQAIVEILEALDDRISLLRETNATLEAIAQALFKSWFVDFDPVRAKQQGREPEGMDAETAALFPDSFEESELGLVPSGWRVGTLGQIADTVRSQRKPSELNSDTNYVGLEHIPRRCLCLANWGSAEVLESAKSCFSKDDILFGKLRPYFHKVVIAPFDGVCSTDILVCQSKQREYYGLVTMHLFSKTLIDYAERLSNGAKMPRINWKDLAAYPIVLPPPDVAESYRVAVDPLFQAMLANVQQIKTLSTLRDTLLPRLISGQLRLQDAEALIEETV